MLPHITSSPQGDFGDGAEVDDSGKYCTVQTGTTRQRLRAKAGDQQNVTSCGEDGEKMEKSEFSFNVLICSWYFKDINHFYILFIDFLFGR